MRMKSVLSSVAVVASLALPALAETAAQSAARESLIAFNERFNELAATHDAITFMSENQGDLSHTIEDLFISDDGTQAVMKGVTRAAVESHGFQLEGSYIYVLERENADAPWRIVLDMFNNYATE